jgi:hypothetical protein
VDRILEIIRALAAAETDRERAAIQGQLAAELRAATPDELQAALAAIRAEATQLATQEVTEANVLLLEQFAAGQQAITEALAARNVQGDLAARQQAALGQLDSQAANGDAGAGDAGSGGDGNAAGDGTQTASGAANGDQGTGEGGADSGAGQQAGGQQRNLGALARGDQSPENRASQIGVRVVVSGTVPGFTPGTELDRATLAQAFSRLAQAIDTGGAPGRHDVAHYEFSYPADHTLSATDARANQERIQAATNPQALVAAAQSGGLCLPLEVIYSINVVGVTARPIRDALTPFRVERGGIQYRLPFDALTMPQGLGVWGQDNDQSVIVSNTGVVTFEAGNDSQGNAFGPKSCLVVDCPGVVEASIYSTYLCLEFANMTSRFDTEWVDATNQAAQVAWARFAENQLLARILAASKIVYSTTQFSAVRDMLSTYDKVISYYRNRHRLDATVPLRTILPQWLIDMLRTDIARMMNTTGDPQVQFAVAQASLESWFRTRNVNVTWHLDGLAATAAPVDGVAVPQQFYNTLVSGQAVPGWPNAVDSVLYREGDWLFLDGGTLDIGLVRDSQLNLRNRYQTFTETFEGVAFQGLESLRVVLPLVPNGASSGTIAPPATTDGMAAYTLAGG